MCCCQIPPYHEFRPRPTRSVDDDAVATRIWASFIAGFALLSLSLASAIWLASRLV